MRGLMMDMPLSIPALLRRTRSLFPHKEIISRRADRSISRSTYDECLGDARRLAAALCARSASAAAIASAPSAGTMRAICRPTTASRRPARFSTR